MVLIRAQRQAEKSATANTFEAVAREWSQHNSEPSGSHLCKGGLDPRNARVPLHRLTSHRQLGATDVLKVLKRIEAGVFTKPRTGPVSDAARCFVMPFKPGAPSVT